MANFKTLRNSIFLLLLAAAIFSTSLLFQSSKIEKNLCFDIKDDRLEFRNDGKVLFNSAPSGYFIYNKGDLTKGSDFISGDFSVNTKLGKIDNSRIIRIKKNIAYIYFINKEKTISFHTCAT